MRRRSAAWLCLISAVGWSDLASAQTASTQQRIRLTYQAPLDCPTQPQFEAQVSQRLAFAWVAGEQDVARPVSIVVVRAQQVWQATLIYRANDGNELTRSVTASTCDASVAAIALATAVLIEDLVADEAVSPFHGQRAASEESAVNSALSGPQPTLPSLAAIQQPAPIPNVATPPNSGLPRHDLSMGVAALSGISASPAYGLIARVGLRVASTLPRLGVAVYQSSSSATDLIGVSIRARVLAAIVEECPVSATLSAQLAVPLCLSVASGILTTRSQIDPAVWAIARKSSDFWLMGDLSARLRVHGQLLFAEFGPDLVVPITRREFVVTRESGRLERAYRTPLVGVGAQLALGVQFQ